MMPTITTEFLVAVLFIVDLFLIFLLFLFVRRVNRLGKGWRTFADARADDGEESRTAAETAAAHAAKDVSQILEPLVVASREAGQEFDRLIREKKKLTKNLNQALDSKMISMNLLLTRAETLHKKLEDLVYQARQIQPAATPSMPAPAVAFPSGPDLLDQQNRILDLYYRKMDVDAIAEQLSIPKGEVRLVIDLKERFLAMEQSS